MATFFRSLPSPRTHPSLHDLSLAEIITRTTTKNQKKNKKKLCSVLSPCRKHERISSKHHSSSHGERASLRLCVSVAGGVLRVPAAESRLASRTNRASQNAHRETGRSRGKHHITARQAGVVRRRVALLRKEDRLSIRAPAI